MKNNLIFEKNNIDEIKKQVDISINKDKIFGKIVKYSELNTILYFLDDNYCKKNIVTIFNNLCKRDTNSNLVEYFYNNYEELLHKKINNLFKIICISRIKKLILKYYEKYSNLITSEIAINIFYSLTKRINDKNLSYFKIGIWMYDNLKEFSNLKLDYNSLFKWACEYNNIDLLKWTYNKMINNEMPFLDISFNFLIACENNSFDVVNWLYKNLNNYIDFNIGGGTSNGSHNKFEKNSPLFYACKNGNIDLLKWFYDNNLYDFHQGHGIIKEDALFVTACKYNKMNICKWLYYDVKNINIHTYSDIAFCHLCYHGNFENIIWLYSKKNIDITARYYLALKFSCNSGNLKLIKWFYKKLEELDIEKKYINNIIYQNSVKYNQLHIMKWLYSITLANDFYNDELLYMICESGNIKILEWLYTLIDNSIIDISIEDYYCIYLIPQKNICKFLEFFMQKDIIIPQNIIKNLLVFSCKHDHIHILKFINDNNIYNIDIDPFLLIASMHDAYNCVKSILLI